MAANPAMNLDTFSDLARQLEAEIGRVIVGQHDVVRGALIGIIAGRHVLLEGVPGLGKTMLIRTLAQVLRLRFSRIQFAPDMQPADITGTDILDEGEDGRRAFRFQPGPVFTNLLLADEINRATPKTQAALLEVMQEQTVTVGGRSYPLDPPFFVMATQNPIEQEGTYPLPEAQLDRFLFKINVGAPDVRELMTIMDRTTGAESITPQPVAGAEDILAMRQTALQVPVEPAVQEVIARLIVASQPTGEGAPTRVRQYVRNGASPRGAQALVLAGKVNALLEGRYNVSYRDIRALAPAALRHRLLLNFDGVADGIEPDALVSDLVEAVVPKDGGR